MNKLMIQSQLKCWHGGKQVKSLLNSSFVTCETLSSLALLTDVGIITACKKRRH